MSIKKPMNRTNKRIISCIGEKVGVFLLLFSWPPVNPEKKTKAGLN
jgi:hypothetical protein